MHRGSWQRECSAHWEKDGLLQHRLRNSPQRRRRLYSLLKICHPRLLLPFHLDACCKCRIFAFTCSFVPFVSELPEEILGEVVWEICCICFPRGGVLEKEPTGQPNGLNEHPTQELDLLFASPQTVDGPLWVDQDNTFASSLLQPLVWKEDSWAPAPTMLWGYVPLNSEAQAWGV